MSTFDTLHGSISTPGLSPDLAALLARLHSDIGARSRDLGTIRTSLLRLLEFLASPAGRTDANCSAVDSFFMLDESWSDLPTPFHDILADMAGALHDTISAPEIARNFDSTPEQLLARANRLPVFTPNA